MSKERASWAITPNQSFSEDELKIINNFSSTFRESLNVVNLTRKVVKNETTYIVQSYAPQRSRLDAVIAKANVESSWLSEKVALARDGIQVVCFSSLESMISNNSLDSHLTRKRARESSRDLDDESSLSSSSRAAAASTGSDESTQSFISVRHSLLHNGSSKEIKPPEANTRSSQGKRTRLVPLTFLQRFLIYALKEFSAQHKHKNNATNITTQNLLMLDYENSVLYTDYNYPFLTVSQITDLVKNERKRLKLKENEDFLRTFVFDSLKNFDDLNFKKSPHALCFDIASSFSKMGFKKATVNFERGVFAVTIKDFDHEEFHQDTPELQDAFAKSTRLYAENINKRYDYSKK
jgi:hypothetical protein